MSNPILPGDASLDKQASFLLSRGYRLLATGARSQCFRKAEELERTQGLLSWTITPFAPDKSVWGLFTREGRR